MIAIGCDGHKQTTMVARLDVATGQLTKPYRVKTLDLQAHLQTLGPDIRVAVETSSSGWFIARQLSSCGIDVLLVDSFKTRRLLETLSRKHSDKLDAQGLTLLLAAGHLDTVGVWIADWATVDLRELVRTREGMVKQGTALRNRVRKLLCRHGLECPFTDLLGQRAREWFGALIPTLRPALALALDELYGSLTDLEVRLARVTAAMTAQAQEHPAAQWLVTLPGIGPILAAVIVAEIGDIRRFPTAAHLRSYARLVPREDQSGERLRRGPLVKHGNRLLSWALIQAAAHFASSTQTRDLRPTKKYRQTVFKYGPNPGKVSLARHLVDVIFAMLRDGKPFDASQLSSGPVTAGACPAQVAA